MGVKGLRSYLSRQPTLGQTITLSSTSASSPPTPLVVDAHALLYNIAFIDPVRGGQFRSVRNKLGGYVRYWMECGLAPEFVFDGVSDISKRDTLIARYADTIKKCNVYMSREDVDEPEAPIGGGGGAGGGRSLSRRLPGLMLGACVAELRKLDVPVHFAEGEADAGAAELAQRRGGYVMSSDSDFFIYRATSLGYIPLTSLTYGGTSTTRLEREHWLGPPQITFRAYQHTQIAALLDIPPQFLPLLGALAGNDHADYSGAFVRRLVEVRELEDALAEAMEEKLLLEEEEEEDEDGEGDERVKRERIDIIPHIAAKLRELAHLAPTLDEPAAPDEQHTALANIFIEVLVALGIRSPSPVMVDTLLASSATYDLHPIDFSSPTFPLHPQPTDSPIQAASRALYLAAFKRGELLMTIPRILEHRIEIRAGALEIPQRPSAALTLATPIDGWVYAILADALFAKGELVVTEFRRKGDELEQVLVPAPSLEKLVRGAMGSRFQWTADKPIIQGLALMRFQLLLRAFGGLPPGVPTFANPLWPLVLALKHIKRHTTSPHEWSAAEFAAALATGAFLLSTGRQPHFKMPSPPKRSFIQRSTELFTSLSMVQILAEALLVSGKLGEGVSTLFDGRLFHALMGLGEEGVVREMGSLRRGEMDWVRAGMRAVMSD